MAIKIRSTPDQRPSVEELRILPSDSWSGNKDQRAKLDRAFWLDENKDEAATDFLIEHAPPFFPIPGNGVTTGVLRRIPFAEIVNELAAGFIDNVEAFSLEPERELWSELSKPIERRKGGGTDRGDQFYARIAAQFIELIQSNDRSPIKSLAKRHTYSENTVKSWIYQARKRGLLDSLGRGRPGGRLSSKANELLRQEGSDDGKHR